MALSGGDRCAGSVPRVRHRAAHHLPVTVRVLDAFRVIKLGFDAVDQVRRRVQQETFGHRGMAGDPRSTASAGHCAAATTPTDPGPGCYAG